MKYGKKLCNTYEKNTASNKVFLMRKLYNLQMKESTVVASHLNEFDSLFAQICAQKMQIDDEMKAIHLLCSLPPSWDTFCMTINNCAADGKLVYNDVSGAILGEEIRRKSMGVLHHGEAHYVQRDGKQRRGRSKQRGSDKDGRNETRGRSKSRSKKDVQCHFCDRYGHYR